MKRVGSSFVLILVLAMLPLFSATADIEHGWQDLFPIDQNGKWGFIDAQGKVVIPPTFESVWGFSEGLAVAKLNKRYGYIDSKGTFVIKPQFSLAFPFNEGLAWAHGDSEGFVDRTGKMVFSAPGLTYCTEFHNGFALTHPHTTFRHPEENPDLEYKIGVIDRSGAEVVKPHYDVVWDFEEGLAAVMSGGKWGFIDKADRFVIPPQFDGATFFSEGLAAVKMGTHFIFVDHAGKCTIPTEYEEANGFSEGLAAVKIGGKWGFINTTGRVVITPIFDDASFFHHGLAVIQVDKKYGYIDEDGKIIVAPQYRYAGDFSGELAPVTFHPEASDGAGTGYINREGKVVWKPKP